MAITTAHLSQATFGFDVVTEYGKWIAAIVNAANRAKADDAKTLIGVARHLAENLAGVIETESQRLDEIAANQEGA